MFDDIQECPHCHGLINREHFARVRDPEAPMLTTMFYCDHCRFGWESLWETAGNGLHLLFTLTHNGRTEPKSLADFRRRLRNAIAA